MSTEARDARRIQELKDKLAEATSTHEVDMLKKKLAVLQSGK